MVFGERFDARAKSCAFQRRSAMSVATRSTSHCGLGRLPTVERLSHSLSFVSSVFLSETDKNIQAGDTLRGSVPSRVHVAAPKFGQWLQLQRGPRSLEQIAIQVRPLLKATGLKIDQSLIFKIEQGRVPSWPLLGALCRVYRTDIREAVLLLIDAVEFPGSKDLLCQSVGVQHASNLQVQEGGADDVLPAPSTRAIAEELRSISDDFIGAIHDVADRLAGGIPDAPPPRTDRDVAALTPHRVRRPRKVG
jgi:hypothetical protein